MSRTIKAYGYKLRLIGAGWWGWRVEIIQTGEWFGTDRTLTKREMLRRAVNKCRLLSVSRGQP